MDQSNRFMELIYKTKNIEFLVDELGKKIGKKLDRNDVINFIEYIKEQRTKQWNNYNKDQINLALINSYTQRINIGNPDIIDMHEALKANMGKDDQDTEYAFRVDRRGNPVTADTKKDFKIENKTLTEIDKISNIDKVTNVINLERLFGISDRRTIQNLFNPQYVSKNYIILDTRYKSSNSNSQEFSWNFLSNTSVTAPGAVNSLGGVSNITAVRFSPIRIPYIDSIINSNYNRVTLLIKEFSGQAYIAQEGRKFHCMFDIVPDGNYINLIPFPDPNNAIFNFETPITQIDTVTLSFGYPLQLVDFQSDNSLVSVTYGATTVFTSPTPHNLQTGDLVYLSNFTTNNTIADVTAISVINRADGFNVIVLDPVTFEIDYNTSSLASPIAGLMINAYYASKRLFVNLELSYRK